MISSSSFYFQRSELIHNIQKLIRQKNIIFIGSVEEESKFVDFKSRRKLDLSKLL